MNYFEADEDEPRGFFKVALLLVIVTCALYAPLIGWGAPHATNADRTYPFAADDLGALGPLAEMHNTFVVEKDDRNFAYPWLHYFLTAAFQAPYLGYAYSTEAWSQPSGEYPFGFRDPVSALVALTYFGRALSVLMAGLTVAFTYLAVARFWSERAARLAALFSLLSHLLMYYGRTGNVDGPMTFWCAAGFYATARIIEQDMTKKNMSMLGIVAACAMATKDQAVLLFLPWALTLLAWACKRGFRANSGGVTLRIPELGGRISVRNRHGRRSDAAHSRTFA